MSRTVLADGLLYVALIASALALAVLLYGFVLRVATPRTVPTVPTAVADDEPPLRRIEVGVRNGAGVDGLAAEATAYLRRRGFDVLEVGTLRPARDSTSVVVRDSGDVRAERVAAALRLPPARIEVDALPESAPEVMVLIGRDFARYLPFSEGRPPAP